MSAPSIDSFSINPEKSDKDLPIESKPGKMGVHKFKKGLDKVTGALNKMAGKVGISGPDTATTPVSAEPKNIKLKGKDDKVAHKLNAFVEKMGIPGKEKIAGWKKHRNEVALEKHQQKQEKLVEKKRLNESLAADRAHDKKIDEGIQHVNMDKIWGEIAKGATAEVVRNPLSYVQRQAEYQSATNEDKIKILKLTTQQLDLKQLSTSELEGEIANLQNPKPKGLEAAINKLRVLGEKIGDSKLGEALRGLTDSLATFKNRAEVELKKDPSLKENVVSGEKRIVRKLDQLAKYLGKETLIGKALTQVADGFRGIDSAKSMSDEKEILEEEADDLQEEIANWVDSGNDKGSVEQMEIVEKEISNISQHLESPPKSQKKNVQFGEGLNFGPKKKPEKIAKPVAGPSEVSSLSKVPSTLRTEFENSISKLIREKLKGLNANDLATISGDEISDQELLEELSRLSKEEITDETLKTVYGIEMEELYEIVSEKINQRIAGFKIMETSFVFGDEPPEELYQISLDALYQKYNLNDAAFIKTFQIEVAEFRQMFLSALEEFKAVKNDKKIEENDKKVNKLLQEFILDELIKTSRSDRNGISKIDSNKLFESFKKSLYSSAAIRGTTTMDDARFTSEYGTDMGQLKAMFQAELNRQLNSLK